MSARSKSATKLASVFAASAIGVLGLAVPQVNAAEKPNPGIAVDADARTRAYAADAPSAVVAAAVVCGSGYNLYRADPLPDLDTRQGTLFVYIKGTNGASNDTPTCSIFDNNTGSTKWMKLKLCSNYTADGCATDQGNFSQYAGPVYRTRGGCGTVTALMKTTESASKYIINAVRDATNCN
ncbi:hypothetical protein [Streptomyces sp. LN785]|uniref:hypothetical protein n=1 Tax=Streptomyces sp. LN785 TaxID=3112983 RepID=UPI00370F86DF